MKKIELKIGDNKYLLTEVFSSTFISNEFLPDIIKCPKNNEYYSILINSRIYKAERIYDHLCSDCENSTKECTPNGHCFIPKNINNINISADDIKELMKIDYSTHAKKTITTLIEYLRQVDKDYCMGRTECNAYSILSNMIQNGTLRMSLYLQILPLIENPKLEYTIKIN